MMESEVGVKEIMVNIMGEGMMGNEVGGKDDRKQSGSKKEMKWVKRVMGNEVGAKDMMINEMG